MELHFVYGGIAAKNFILPISKSSKNESIIFYQKSYINDNLTINGIKTLPRWFDIKISPKLNFTLKLVNLRREKPEYKNLKYKKILSHLSKMDNSKSDIALISNKKILETGTSNLLFVKDDKVFTPKKGYYEGNTFKFFKKNIKNIIKGDIFIHELDYYDEIMLVGSGKGVVSIKAINQIDWRRKNLRKFNQLSKLYNTAIKNCNIYKF